MKRILLQCWCFPEAADAVCYHLHLLISFEAGNPATFSLTRENPPAQGCSLNDFLRMGAFIINFKNSRNSIQI
jgi:hypothetical protein